MKMDMRIKTSIVTAVVCFLGFRTLAQDLEHPTIKPLPKSLLEKGSKQNDYIYEFPFFNGDKKVMDYKSVKGEFWKLSYTIFGKDPQRVDGVFSEVEIIRAYRTFTLKQGGVILWERSDGGRLSFSVPGPHAGLIWCEVFARDGFYMLNIVEEGASEKNATSDDDSLHKRR